MRRISSSWTFYYKRAFPAAWCSGLFLIGAIGAYAAATRPMGKGFWPFFIVLPVMLVLGLRFMKKFVFDLVDEVWDDGNSLLVKNGGQSERIALHDISNVNYTTTMNPPRVVLSLRRPTLFGKQIAFSAPVYLLPFTRSSAIDDLIERIDRARGGREHKR
jgi:hypothetical protein